MVDFTESLGARQLLFWRVLFEELMIACQGPEASREMFAQLKGSGLGTLRSGLTVFLRRHFGPWLAGKYTDSDAMLLRLQSAEAGLSQA